MGKDLDWGFFKELFIRDTIVISKQSNHLCQQADILKPAENIKDFALFAVCFAFFNKILHGISRFLPVFFLCRDVTCYVFLNCSSHLKRRKMLLGTSLKKSFFCTICTLFAIFRQKLHGISRFLLFFSFLKVFPFWGKI